MRAYTSAAVLLLATLVACFPRLDTTPAEIESMIARELPDRAEEFEIDAFLKSTSWEYSFDPHTDRYQAIIRHPDSNLHAISIYLYVDETGRFIRAEAHDSYTFL